MDEEAAAQDIVVASAPSITSRECRTLTTVCNKDAYICIRALLEHMFVTELKGDSRQSDESGYGVVAREFFYKGEHFYDPSV